MAEQRKTHYFPLRVTHPTRDVFKSLMREQAALIDQDVSSTRLLFALVALGRTHSEELRGVIGSLPGKDADLRDLPPDVQADAGHETKRKG